jgi:hypothetical protein
MAGRKPTFASAQAAIAALRGAAMANPAQPSGWIDLGNALCQAGEATGAIAAYERAIELDPKSSDAYSNLAVALSQCGDLDAAVTALQKALAANPNAAAAWNNLGSLHLMTGQLDQAETAVNRAIELQGDFAEAHFSRSLIWLSRGDFRRGWAEYEWRLKSKSVFMPQAPKFPQPRWNGEALAGRRIFLYSEAGFGDTIHFARYVPLVAERGGRVVLGCQPQLVRLLRQLSGVDQVVTTGMPLPAFDVHCPLLSLPFVFQTDLHNIPSPAGYLQPDDLASGQWKVRAGATASLIKVGVAWAGAAHHRMDRWRSIDLKEFSRFFDMQGIQFFSLQKERENPAVGALTDWTGELRDFHDTAALIASLDLVISVDTAVAHLAGALGKPAWILLPAAADYRWLLDRTDSPWYASARLFRQSKLGQWGGVIEEVRSALREKVKASSRT